MKKVYQTRSGIRLGNCLQACVASMFERHIDVIPDFGQYGRYWLDRMESWLKVQGLKMEWVDYEGGRLKLHNGCQICVLPSHGNKCTHAVLVNSVGRIIHDPKKGGVSWVGGLISDRNNVKILLITKEEK